MMITLLIGIDLLCVSHFVLRTVKPLGALYRVQYTVRLPRSLPCGAISTGSLLQPTRYVVALEINLESAAEAHGFYES
jgi:hypothetical protein